MITLLSQKASKNNVLLFFSVSTIKHIKYHKSHYITKKVKSVVQDNSPVRPKHRVPSFTLPCGSWKHYKSGPIMNKELFTILSYFLSSFLQLLISMGFPMPSSTLQMMYFDHIQPSLLSLVPGSYSPLAGNLPVFSCLPFSILFVSKFDQDYFSK